MQLCSVAIRKYRMTERKDAELKTNMSRITTYLSTLDVAPTMVVDSGHYAGGGSSPSGLGM